MGGDPSFIYPIPGSRNAWSLFNAFTSVYREINPHTALRRGEALHGLFDAVVGMS